MRIPGPLVTGAAATTLAVLPGSYVPASAATHSASRGVHSVRQKLQSDIAVSNAKCPHASIFSTPQSGPVGSKFLIKGNNWVPGSTVHLTLPYGSRADFHTESANPRTGTGTASGGWQTVVTVGKSTPPGRYTIIASQAAPGCPARRITMNRGFTVTRAFKGVISAGSGWQTIGYVKHPGSIHFSASGSWTVDQRRDHELGGRVGPDGYGRAADEKIGSQSRCKIVRTVPYGALIGQIGNGPVFVVGTAALQGASEDSGPLKLRINDADACLGDNAGTVEVSANVT